MPRYRYTCFLSCRFDDKDAKLINGFANVIRTAGIRPYIAKEKRAIPPVEKIRERLAEADCLIAILTRSRKIEGESLYVCSDWVQNEIGMAFILDKPIVALYEDNVDIQGVQRWVSDFVKFRRGHELEVVEEIAELLASLKTEINRRRDTKQPALQTQQLRQLASTYRSLPDHEIRRLKDEGILVYYGREQTIHGLQELIDRAQRHDVLFGHCRTCAFYPQLFRRAISRAVSRGVACHSIIQEVPDSTPFARFLLGLPLPEDTVRSLRSDDIRYMGIKDREFFFVLPVADQYVGINFRNRKLAGYLYTIFEQMWKGARKIGSADDIDW